MKTIIETQKEIPVFSEADVVVVGGGPAGIGAALAAARNGANTILLEQANCLGGMQTQCLNPRFSYVDPDIVGRIIQEIVDRLKREGAIVTIAEEKRDFGPLLEPMYSFDPECYKYLLENMMEEAGVKLLYHAFAVGAVKEGNSIKGILIESKEGRRAVLGKVVIDSTGSADIAWKSGTPCLSEGFPSGPKKGRHMGFSYAVAFRNVDTSRFETFKREHPEEWGSVVAGKGLIKKAKGEGNLYGNRGAFCMVPHLGTGTIWILGPCYGLPMGHHGWMLEDFSNGEIDLRKQAWSAYHLLKNNVPGWENSHIDQTPTHLLLRDMHRISGEYVLKEDDMRQGRAFDDSIAISNALPDVFGPDDEHELFGDFPPFDIPYRCIVPKETENLLAAGSTISVDLMTYAAVRYCTPSVCTGQAAGTAAALAVKNNVIPRKLDVALLRETLREQGTPISVKYLSKTVLDKYRERARKAPRISLGPN